MYRSILISHSVSPIIAMPEPDMLTSKHSPSVRANPYTSKAMGSDLKMGSSLSI
jgi:hypothetical protein